MRLMMCRRSFLEIVSRSWQIRRRLFYEPLVGLINHSYELSHDVIIDGIQSLADVIIKILALSGKFNPYLGFTGFTFRIVQFGNKRGLESPFAPGSGYVGANGSGRTPQLIGHGILFLGRELLGEFKNFHGGIHRILKNAQIFVAVNFFGHFSPSPQLKWRPLFGLKVQPPGYPAADFVLRKIG
jgi:hypothetical protein